MNDIPLLLNPAFRLQHLGIQGSINFQLPVRRSRAKVDQLSTLNLLQLLNHFFKLCAKHIHASIVVKVATKRDVKPIALLAFDDKLVGLSEGRGIRRIPPCLRDNIDQQIRNARLRVVPDSPVDSDERFD